MLTRALLRRLGFDISLSGEGPDGGKDMLARISVLAPLRPHPRTWVVECKDNSVAERSVGVGDVASITDRLFQHRADGFLLVTTTRATSGLTARLDAIHDDPRTPFVTAIWDGDELTRMLLEESARDLLRQYFPDYFRNHFGIEASVAALVSAGLPGDLKRLIQASLAPAESTRPAAAVVCGHIEADEMDAALAALDPMPFEEWSAVMARVQEGLSAGEFLPFLEHAAVADGAEDRRFAYTRLALRAGVGLAHLLPALATLDDESVSMLVEETDVKENVERLLADWLEGYGGDKYDVDGAWLWMMDEFSPIEATTSMLRLQAEFSTSMNCQVGAGGGWEISANGLVTVELTDRGTELTDVQIDLPDLTD